MAVSIMIELKGNSLTITIRPFINKRSERANEPPQKSRRGYKSGSLLKICGLFNSKYP